jgi:putative FmdB family regulatory protein
MITIHKQYILGVKMPIYEYLCQNCGVKFDVIRPIKEADAPIACTICGSLSTKRSISVFFAQSSVRIVAGNNSSNCSGCAGGSCSSCGH